MLAYSWFVMLYQFQAHGKVFQLYMYFSTSFFRFFSHIEFPMLYSRCLLIFYFIVEHICWSQTPNLFPSTFTFPFW